MKRNKIENGHEDDTEHEFEIGNEQKGESKTNKKLIPPATIIPIINFPLYIH